MLRYVFNSMFSVFGPCNTLDCYCLAGVEEVWVLLSSGGRHSFAVMFPRLVSVMFESRRVTSSL